jgi:hypothetical protein
MEVSATQPIAWSPAPGPELALGSDASLPPDLALLALMVDTRSTQSTAAQRQIDDAFEQLSELRTRIQQAIEQAMEAEEDAGFWGEVAGVFGSDVATVAGAVAAAALVVGTGGSGAAVVVAAMAVGFSLSGEVAEKLDLDPKIVMALQVAGALSGLCAGDPGKLATFWKVAYVSAKVVEGGSLVAGGGARIAEGQYQGDAQDARAQHTYLRNTEQLEQALTDEQIAELRELFSQQPMLFETASSITATRHEQDAGVIRRIGG